LYQTYLVFGHLNQSLDTNHKRTAQLLPVICCQRLVDTLCCSRVTAGDSLTQLRQTLNSTLREIICGEFIEQRLKSLLNILCELLNLLVRILVGGVNKSIQLINNRLVLCRGRSSFLLCGFCRFCLPFCRFALLSWGRGLIRLHWRLSGGWLSICRNGWCQGS